MGQMHAHPEPRTPPPDLAARLRARGLRVTAQREHVLDAVRGLGHATSEQIVEAVPGVDVTTVYRTLELLEELGLVRHAHLGHGAPSYRPAEDDHIHVVCHSCGGVVDAPSDLIDALELRLHDERGFQLDRSHFTVFGRCGDCVAADRPDSDGRSPEQSPAAPC
jgi:Fur family ferric uptake transcriptional regulator